MTSTLVGKYFCNSNELFGQPNVAIGQMPDENHVSRTSVSLVNFFFPDISIAFFSVGAQ